MDEKDIREIIDIFLTQASYEIMPDFEALDRPLNAAAHLIAERLAEGVVWERQVELYAPGSGDRLYLYGVGTEEHSYTEQGEYYGEIMDLPVEFDGSIVTVTLRKKL